MKNSLRDSFLLKGFDVRVKLKRKDYKKLYKSDLKWFAPYLSRCVITEYDEVSYLETIRYNALGYALIPFLAIALLFYNIGKAFVETYKSMHENVTKPIHTKRVINWEIPRCKVRSEIYGKYKIYEKDDTK